MKDLFRYGVEGVDWDQVTPWGRQAIQAWQLVDTQIDRVGMDAVPSRLIYEGAVIILRHAGLDHPEVWAGLQDVEREFLAWAVEEIKKSRKKR